MQMEAKETWSSRFLKIKKIIRDKEVPGATTGDPTDDKVMWKRTVKQGFRTQRAP